MSAPNVDFNKLFQDNMEKLDSLQQGIAAKISEKTTFSKQILPQLKEINTKVLRVRDKFNELNRRLSDLEKQIKEKDSGIADAGTACAGLQEEIQRLKTELANSQQQQRDLEQTYNTRFQELTEEKDKMRSEQVQLQQTIAQLEEKQRSLQAEINALTQQLEQSRQNMEKMVQENQQLKEQHQALSQKINEIKTQIDGLIAMDTVNPEEITALLEQIKNVIDEIDKAPGVATSVSASSISNETLTGNNSRPSVGQQMGKTLDAIYGTYNQNTLNNVNSGGMSLRQIIDNLYKRPAFNKDGVTNSKYSNALNAILALKGRVNGGELTNIFKVNRIADLDEDELEGGKRSKKSRKSRKTQKKMRRRRQKGGYTYSDKTKRRRFTTVSPRSSSPGSYSSSRSSRKTSTTSHSQNYKARGKSKKTM